MISEKIRMNFKTIVLFSSVTLIEAALAAWDSWGLASLILLALLQLAPAVFCLRKRRMDYLSIILCAQFVGYSLFPLAQSFTAPLSPVHLQAVHALIVCTALLIAGTALVRKFFYRVPHRQEVFHPLPLSAPGLFGLLGVLLLSFYFASEVPEDLQRFFGQAQFLCLVLAFCVSVPRRYQVTLGMLQLGIGVYVFYSFLAFANLGFAINLAVIWIAQSILQRRFKPMLRLALLVLPLLFLQSVKGEYRGRLVHDPKEGVWTRADWLWGMVGKKISGTETRRVDSVLDDTLDRAHDESLEKVLEWTPSRVPFWNGESYKNFFLQLIPRIFWPSKPHWNLDNDFGQRYGYLDAKDTKTEVVFSYFAEGYMNFGWGAVFAVAIFMALLIPLVEKISEFDLHGYYSITFICFLMPLLSYQIDLGAVLAKLLFTALFVLPLRAPGIFGWEVTPKGA
jgi:hypothetical protein